MKKIFAIFSLLILCLSSLSAQTFKNNLSSQNFDSSNPIFNSGKLKILSVMVEFQTDKDEATFGDGTFGSIYSKDYGNNILDPLPHDKQYFENHLEFAKNYFSKVSKGKLTIDFTVFDQIIKVSKTIRDYSPPANNKKDFTNLANFSKEVWTIAASKGIDLSVYDMFIIFHAGVGGDVLLPGSIGNEKDLPSVFLGLNSLKKIYGETFSGFNFSSGNVTNTAIIPCTESRELVGITGTNLLQLSINGLLAASIGSFIGLPDLYNTETGISAVGRFALMDGQSIFNYGGLFPPELSVWEKYFLNWIDPIEVNSDKKISITNHISADDGDSVYIKIPISNSEYFLLENRKRDAKKDGCKITYKIGSNYFPVSFLNDIDKFNYYNVDSIKGVVVDVDEFDWALPGIDSDDESSNFQDVGFLIWHIDEKIISKNLSSNSINNDKYERGVRLVEADGIFDIGERFTTIFGDEVIGDGTKEDTWYKSNPAHYYKNRFNDYSKPSAKSNSGANSLVNISGISDVDNKMSFILSFGSTSVKPISHINFSKKVLWTKIINENNRFFFYLFTGDSVFKYDDKSNILFKNDFKSKFKPAVVKSDYSLNFIGVADNLISYLSDRPNSVTLKTWSDSVNYSTSAVIDRNLEFYIGTDNGEIYRQSITEAIDINKNVDDKIKVSGEKINQIAYLEGNVFAITENKYWDSNIGELALKSSPIKFVVEKNQNGYTTVNLAEGNRFIIIKDGIIVNEFTFDGDSVENFQLNDLFFDGNNYITFVSGNKIYAYNFNGVSANNFPIKNNTDKNFISNPVQFIKEDFSKSLVLAFAEDETINLFNVKSTAYESTYPAVIDFNPDSYPDFIVSDDKTYMLFQQANYGIKFYQIADYSMIANIQDDNNSIVFDALTLNRPQEYFPKNMAYNYPNPVYDDVTYIRFYVKENSNARIKIFDLTGNLIDEFSTQAVGGMENEVMWNVKNIQSGIYFANLSVQSNSGKSFSNNIKIAVVK